MQNPHDAKPDGDGDATGAERAEDAPETDADPVAALTAENSALAAEVEMLKDQALRAMAEMDNLRRRTRREVEDAQKFALTGFARDIVGIADDLRRALDSVPEEALAGNDLLRTLAEGIELTERNFLGKLEKYGISQVTRKGEAFDHNLHQAVFEVPTDAVPPGTVVQVLESGFTLHERLLRPATVGVSKATGGTVDAGRTNGGPGIDGPADENRGNGNGNGGGSHKGRAASPSSGTPGGTPGGTVDTVA